MRHAQVVNTNSPGAPLLARFKIGPRLAAGFALITLLMLCVAGIGIWGLRVLHQDIRHIVEVQNPRIQQIHAIADEANAIAVAARDALIAESEDEARPHISRVEKGRQIMGNLLAKLDQSVASDGEAAKKTQSDLHSAYGAYTIEQVKLIRAIAAGKKEMARKFLAEGVQPRLQDYLATLSKMREYEAGLMRASEESARRSYERGRLGIAGIVLLAALLTAVLAVMLTRGITRPLDYASNAAAAVSRGDLTQTIHAQGRDETAQLTRSLSMMQAQLATIVRQIKAASDTVSAGTMEIARGNAILSQRSESQASSLEQTSASIEQLTSMGRQNAERAGQAATLAEASSRLAGEGGSIVADVVKTMQAIDASSPTSSASSTVSRFKPTSWR